MFATLAGEYPWPDGPDPAGALRAVLAEQAEAGLELLSDGRIHDLRHPLAVAWLESREASADVAPNLPVKVAIRGPWALGGAGGSLAAARTGNVALRALAAAGCSYVEVHEPAARLPTGEPDGLAFAAAHLALLDDLPDEIHASLAITGGDATALGAANLFAAAYRSHLFDVIAGPDNWRLIALAPGDRGIVLGTVDATRRRRVGLEEITWAVGYAGSTGGRGVVRVGIAPSAGLGGLAPSDARSVLALIGSAAAALSGDREELLDLLDPRAIDARTAALGHDARRARAAPRVPPRDPER